MHRGVTLLSTAYTMYASVLTDRLEREIKKKRIVLE